MKVENLILDCLTHQKKQCFQCNYEKTCDGLNFQQRQSTDCDTMKIEEYEKLVTEETELLQTKVTSAIDSAINKIEKEQSVMIAKLKFDPRKSSISKVSWEVELKISDPGLSKSKSVN